MFRITAGKGFQMTFENGWTASVQWGTGNYCDNRDMRYSPNADIEAGQKGSKTAEIAAWDADGEWHNFGNDEVKGWVTPDEVVEFLSLVASFAGNPSHDRRIAHGQFDMFALDTTK